MVFASGNYMEAQFVASVLNGNDVAASVFDDNVCRIYAPEAILVGGAKVIVSARDVERSQEVLAGVEAGGSPITEHLLSIPLSEPAA